MPDGVIGLAEVAQLLGVAKRTAAKYVDLPSFPAPLAELATGRVWRTEDVEAWAKATLPLRPGRPPRESSS